MRKIARRKNRLTEAKINGTGGALGVTGATPFDDLENATHAFIRDCRLRNLSEQTVVYYRNELSWFRKLLEEQDVETSPQKITLGSVQDNVVLYLMDEKGCKVTTINSLLRAVRSFFNFLERREAFGDEGSPLAGLKLLKAPSHAVETFSAEQINALLNQPDQRTFTGVRDSVIILLFLETGIRLRELTDLTLKDVRWEDSQINVLGKNGQYRLVPIQRTMLRALRKWAALRAEVDHDYLFINIDNQPISKRQVQSRITKYGRMADIKNVRCSPHTLRHTFAKMSVKNGANVFDLQKILGHSSLDMVRVYVNLFSEDVLESHKKFSPLEGLLRRG